MATYFITGGLGFLGQYIVQAIHEHDPQSELRVLVRTQRKMMPGLEKLDRVKWVQGELTRPETFEEYLKGVDTIIHNAAMISFKKADAQKVYDANVIGTHNLAQAAREAGCKNFIFISSISAVDFRPPQITDETMIPDLEFKRKDDIYGYTKLLSENELKEMSDEMRVVILNPSVILGPGSERVEMIVKAVRKMPFLPTMDYVNAFVDVRDVARAVTLALTKGRSGERYIVSAHNARMVEFTREIVKHIKKNLRVVVLSPFGLSLMDKFISLLDFLHLNPGVRRPSQMNIDKPCSHEKIKREMGWEPTFTLEQSIADSIK
ncbi:MAG: NAD-dependent epimerase/dehydratase family protein [Chloroflexi bacterium]|nr:NAD-dependent epimerase/dehydratase family protein [Chloroflexota bacterium]